MEKDLIKRFKELENIIEEMDTNQCLLELLFFGLKKKKYCALNNDGLFWITNIIIERQIIDFYKVSKPQEKHSFRKLINLCNQGKEKNMVKELIEKVDCLEQDFDNSRFGIIREKYLAHLDVDPEEERSDLLSIMSFTSKVANLFQSLCAAVDFKLIKYSDNIVMDLKNIFSDIDKLEEIGLHIDRAKRRKKRTVSITQIETILSLGS